MGPQKSQEGAFTCIGDPEAPALGTRGLCHWAPGDTFYLGPLVQDREVWLIYRTHGRDTERGKTRRRRSIFPMKTHKAQEKEPRETEASSLPGSKLERPVRKALGTWGRRAAPVSTEWR